MSSAGRKSGELAQSRGAGRFVWDATLLPSPLSAKPTAPATHKALQMTNDRIARLASRQAPTHTTANAATPTTVITIGAHRPSVIVGLLSPALVATPHLQVRSRSLVLVQDAPTSHAVRAGSVPSRREILV